MGRLSHEPGRTVRHKMRVSGVSGDGRGTFRRFVKCHFIAFRGPQHEYGRDRLKAVTQAFLPAQGCTLIFWYRGCGTIGVSNEARR